MALPSLSTICHYSNVLFHTMPKYERSALKSVHDPHFPIAAKARPTLIDAFEKNGLKIAFKNICKSYFNYTCWGKLFFPSRGHVQKYRRIPLDFFTFYLENNGKPGKFHFVDKLSLLLQKKQTNCFLDHSFLFKVYNQISGWSAAPSKKSGLAWRQSPQRKTKTRKLCRTGSLFCGGDHFA